jgi:hypothetical protein
VLGGGTARGGIRGDVTDAENTDLHDVPFRSWTCWLGLSVNQSRCICIYRLL